MTEAPEDIAERLVRALENPTLPGYTCLMPVEALRDGIRDAIALALAAQRERDARVADEAAKAYSAAHAVDTETQDYLTVAASCAAHIAAAIRGQE